MIRLEIGPPSRTWQYRQVDFDCPHCGVPEYFSISDDPAEHLCCTFPPVSCKTCGNLLPEIDVIMVRKDIRYLWHKTPGPV